MVLDDALDDLPEEGTIDLTDAVVLLTGGAGNLGRELTRHALEAGARVAVPLYHKEAGGALDPLLRQYGDRLITFSLDLTTDRGAEQAVQHTGEWGGRIDVLIHLVGGFEGGSRLAEDPVEVWNRMLALNLTSAYLVSRYAIPRMVHQGNGNLVFISSRSAFASPAYRAAYAAAKAGLVALTRAIAEEYAEEGIRCNVVVPDTLDTPENRKSMPDADFSSWVPLERISRTILYLASEDSRPLSGAAVPVFPA